MVGRVHIVILIGRNLVATDEEIVFRRIAEVQRVGILIYGVAVVACIPRTLSRNAEGIGAAIVIALLKDRRMDHLIGGRVEVSHHDRGDISIFPGNSRRLLQKHLRLLLTRDLSRIGNVGACGVLQMRIDKAKLRSVGLALEDHIAHASGERGFREP